MKTKRRQELKSNDLAQMLDDLRDSFNRWGVYILGGVAVVLVVYAITTSITSARVAQVDSAYDELLESTQIAPGGIRKSDQDILQNLEKMKRLAAESNDPEFKLEALIQRCEMALGLALTDPEGPKMGFLESAKDGFETIIADYPKRRIYVGRAHHGMFQVLATMFSVDGDLTHKAEALKHLEAIRDDAAYAQTPLMAAALDRINQLDSLFVPVTFPKAPPKESMDSMNEAAGSQMPSITVGGDNAGNIELVPANPPMLEKLADEADSSPTDEAQADESDNEADDEAEDDSSKDDSSENRDGAIENSDEDGSATENLDADNADTNG